MIIVWMLGGVYDDDEYRRQKRAAELDLESLVLPEADAAAEAGKLISQLPRLWSGANLEERRKLLLTAGRRLRRLEGEHDCRDQT